MPVSVGAAKPVEGVGVCEGPVVAGTDVESGGLRVLIAVRKTGVIGVAGVIGVPKVPSSGQACNATG